MRTPAFRNRFFADPPRIFRAGAATSNINCRSARTSPVRQLKAERIHDEQHVRCLALDDGATKPGSAIVDSCVIERAVFDAAKRKVHEATGLPMENMLMSATHSHSCAC